MAGPLAAAVALFVVLAAASAETVNLELKRLEPLDRVYRANSPQTFSMQVGLNRPDAQADEFAKIVKKQPEKYNSESPLRGVATLGSGQYAFVLDQKAEEPKEEPQEEPAEEPTEEKSAEEQSDQQKPEQTKPKVERPKAYDLLYFDLNHNGDLTDDEPIEGTVPQSRAAAVRRSLPLAYSMVPSASSSCTFPRVDLTIDVDGTEAEYAFFLTSQSSTRRTTRLVSAFLMAAAYRAGEITINGESKRVALIDSNSNGRFDDGPMIDERIRESTGRLYPRYGDWLLIDPAESGRNLTAARHFVAKLLTIDGEFYDMAVSPAGDKLTLTPCSAATGRLTSPNSGLEVTLYSDKGILNVTCNESEPTPCPEGTWNLVSCTINRTEEKKPDDQEQTMLEVKPKEGDAKEQSSPPAMARAMMAARARSNLTRLSAYGTVDCKPIEVRAGETTVLPFGPQYKPIVKSSSRIEAGKTAQLGLSLLGAGGETCSSLMVDGKRPDKPTFTISTPDGEELTTGSFEYG
ncbi:MAG: hypothetical protein A2V70_02240 [Planctomycetes bacterium RBG_13_63_9]|nr:MAG: hypothetical protein A2V70_02240 [Planctomycetes bacterium RBG_13_63_9]